MLLTRVLSRQGTQLQLQQLHKVLNFTANVCRLQQLHSRVACAGRAARIGRNYATAATNPTRTVKTAVKRAARTPARSTSKASKTAKASKAKKPAKRAAAKKTAKTPRKKVAKKKVAPKKKKAPSERQVALAKKKKINDRITELRKAALSPPPRNGLSAWTAYTSEQMKTKSGTESITDVIKSAASAYKNLTAAEREHYNHISNESKATATAEYKSWVEKHTPLEIRDANRARAALLRFRKLHPEFSHRIPASQRQIADERQVKKPLQPIIFFTSERHQSGDLKNISITESGKLCGAEWKALSESERKKYYDLAAKDSQRYRAEHLKVYGTAPSSRSASPAP